MNSVAESDRTTPSLYEVRYEASGSLIPILEHLQASILVSTYQAGKVLSIGAHQGELRITFLHFDQAMGLAYSPQRIAIGSRRQIHFMRPAPDVAPRVEPAGTHDGCWSIRQSHYTGNIHGHDLAWGEEGLWIVNTLFSCLCTLDEQSSFVPRWRPPFISQLSDQDRCHLNGLAIRDGQPSFVSVLGRTDSPAGWRESKATGGCLLEVPSGETVASGLAMPHSPRWHDERLWILDSGRGLLGTIDLDAGRVEEVASLPGYTRGLSFAGQFAFVGLSKIRETNIFGGLPISERADELRCGIGVVDLLTGRTVATFQFHSGVEEIFAVEVLPRCKNPYLFGMTSSSDEESKEVWIVPPEGKHDLGGGKR